MGVTIAGLGYGVDKVIQHDSKKLGAPIEPTGKSKDQQEKKKGSKLKKGLYISR